MKWPDSFEVGALSVGRDCPPLLIAEAGVNHNGSVERAMEMVEAAADARIPVVKFQTFRADALVSPTAPKGEYQKQTTGEEGSQHEMLRRLELDARDFERLAAACARRGVLFLSTPFDEESADLLDSLGMPVFKLSSADLTNLPLLSHIAQKRRPMILSTGMSYPGEIATAVETCRAAGCPSLALLQCVSSYPASPEECNLRAMDTLAMEFGVPIGFSDHTPGIHIALAAVARGACIIEKHFTLDRNLPGPDHRASSEVGELGLLWKQMQEVYSSLGDGEKSPRPGEAKNRAVARRSLHWKTNLAAGTAVGMEHLIALRPEGGLPPDAASELFGRTLSVDVEAGSMVRREALSEK